MWESSGAWLVVYAWDFFLSVCRFVLPRCEFSLSLLYSSLFGYSRGGMQPWWDAAAVGSNRGGKQPRWDAAHNLARRLNRA